MTEGNGHELNEPVRIVIEYDPRDGRFNLSCNVKDEILTTGMIAKANDVLKQNYRMAEMRDLKKKMDGEIITAPAELKVQ